MKIALSIAKSLMFLLMAVSVIVPRAHSLSFCNPMDAIMLQSCCHPEVHPPLEDGADSIHRPSCCDEIAVPTTDADGVSQISVPLVGYTPIRPSMPTLDYEALTDTLATCDGYQARGPPPDPLLLFRKYCSYRI